MNRLDMIKDITLSTDKPPIVDVKMFEDCMQEFYPCIYNMYSLLMESKVNLNKVKFKKPTVIDSQTISFSFSLNDEYEYDRLINVIKLHDTKLTYLRHHTCTVELKGTLKKISLTVRTLN